MKKDIKEKEETTMILLAGISCTFGKRIAWFYPLGPIFLDTNGPFLFTVGLLCSFNLIFDRRRCSQASPIDSYWCFSADADGSLGHQASESIDIVHRASPLRDDAIAADRNFLHPLLEMIEDLLCRRSIITASNISDRFRRTL